VLISRNGRSSRTPVTAASGSGDVLDVGFSEDGGKKKKNKK